VKTSGRDSPRGRYTVGGWVDSINVDFGMAVYENVN